MSFGMSGTARWSALKRCRPPATLHSIHDPLCGWCSVAGPLVKAAAAAIIAVVLHGGEL